VCRYRNPPRSPRAFLSSGGKWGESLTENEGSPPFPFVQRNINPMDGEKACYTCDRCGVDQPVGATMHGCRPCEYSRQFDDKHDLVIYMVIMSNPY
jgi:hypothetical protein